MRTALLLPSALGILLLASCGGDADSSAADAETPATAGARYPALSSDALAEMRVRLESLDGLEVELSDGIGTGQMGEIVTLLAAYQAVGDFDGDGAPEAAVLVASEPGGTGVFTHLVAVRGGPDGPVQIAETMLGDRQQFHRFEASGDSLLVELTTHGPRDAMCCPTRRAEQIYLLRDGVWRLWRDNTISAATPERGSGAPAPTGAGGR